jgi:Transposase DDE domain group 1
MDQRRQDRDQVDATVVLHVRRQCGASSVARAGLQSRQLHADAGLAEAVAQWSLTSLREKLIKIGAKVVRHARYAVFQMAEVAVPRELFEQILRLIDGLRRRPAQA